MLSVNKKFVGAVSATLLSAVALWEGTSYYAYKDIGGVPTVCQGYTGKGIVFGKKYSEQECNVFLRREVVEHSNGVLACVKKPLKEHQFNAFVLFAYNVGVNGFCESRALRLFNEGNASEACKAIAYGPSGKPAWSYVDRKYVQGLHNRRLYEMKMCLGA